MPKCASSSIQAALITKRADLRDNSIYLADKNFKVCKTSSAADPHGIPYSVIFDHIDKKRNVKDLISNTLDSIIEERNDDKFDFLVSSELLSFIGSPEGEAVHSDILSIFDNSLAIIVIRSPWSLVFSNWRQGVYREGITFEEYASKVMRSNQSSKGYFDNRINLFNKYYKEVRIVPIETSTNIVNDFLSNISCSHILNNNKTHQNRNKSLAPVFCEVMCKFPELFKDEMEDRRNVKPRHKNILSNIVAGNSQFFSDSLTLGQYTTLDTLKDFFQEKYIELLNAYSGLTSSHKDWCCVFDRQISEKYAPFIVNDANRIDLVEFMLADVVSNLKHKAI